MNVHSLKKRKEIMEITDVTIYPFESDSERDSAILAFADVVLDNQVKLKGFKIIRTKSGGLFIGYPSQRSKTGTFFDTVITLNKETKELFRTAIIDAYKNYSVTGFEGEDPEESPPF